jgi:hypothetical protein
VDRIPVEEAVDPSEAALFLDQFMTLLKRDV